MKAINKDSYLELDKYPELIFNINRLIKSKIDIKYIEEYRKYLAEAVNEVIINDSGEYVIDLDTIKSLSIIYCLEDDEPILEVIEELIVNKLLIKNANETFCFNEDIYDKDLVNDEKDRLNSPANKLIHRKAPWSFKEDDSWFILEGYSDELQEIATIGIKLKEGNGDDELIKEMLLEFIDAPDYFYILCNSLKYIKNELLKLKINKLISSILNFDPEIPMISTYDEFWDFIDNKTNDKLEILDVSEIYGTTNTLDIVDDCNIILTLYLNDIDLSELWGCMALIIHFDDILSLIIDVAEELSPEHPIYIEISNIFGEEELREWLK